jgi:hypothetical protein
VREGIDLGFPLEFRTGAELSFAFRDKSRLALQFTHLSNGGIAPDNPGTENIALIFGIPVKGRKK